MSWSNAKRIPLVALAAASLMLAGCAGTQPEQEQEQSESVSVRNDLAAMLPEEIQESGVITIASPYGVAPSIFVDEGGEPTGIAYDISQEIGALLGVDVEWQELAFSGVISGLQAGNFDLSMGVIGDTAERQEVLDFVDLMKNESVLLVLKDSEDLGDLEEACGRTIGALAGSLQISRLQGFSENCTATGNDPITINEYPGAPDAQTQVQAGRIDGYFAPYLQLAHTAATAGGGDTFTVGTAFYPDNPWAIAMQKDRGDLSKAIRGALETLVENGTYAEILEQYKAEAAALDPEQVLINGAGTDAFPLS